MTDLTIFHPTLGAATARKIRNDQIKEAEAYRLSKKAMAGSPRPKIACFRASPMSWFPLASG